jgi:hypothetical protein
MPENDIHVLAAFIGVVALVYTNGLPEFSFLIFFILGAMIASFKKIGKIYGLSPDLDNFGIIKQLFGHRSIVFHSPLLPVIILNLLGIDFLCNDPWGSDIYSALAYGFCFGWLMHVTADGIQSIWLWNIPFRNAKKTTRLILGIICLMLTLITLLSVFFISSGYLKIPILQETLVFFRNFILGLF